MKKNSLSLGAAPSYVITITWLDGPGAGNTTPFSTGTSLTAPSAINSTPFTITSIFEGSNLPGTPSEFRMIAADGLVGGIGEKSLILGTGDESWSFDDPTGLMNGVPDRLFPVTRAQG